MGMVLTFAEFQPSTLQAFHLPEPLCRMSLPPAQDGLHETMTPNIAEFAKTTRKDKQSLQLLSLDLPKPNT